MSLPGSPTSLWLDRPAVVRMPVLESDAETDVAVIGGGIVGATAALLLAERGVDVLLIEAREIAGGVTGHSTAKASALHETSYSAIARGVGREAARSYAELNSHGVRLIDALAERHSIECSLERADNYLYTEDPGAAGTVEAEAQAAAEAGLPVRVVTETELPFPIATAAMLPGQIAFDSAAFTRGVAAAAQLAGATVHEESRVRRVRHGRPCVVELENGASVRARDVILATHMPLLDRGLFFARLRPQASYSVAGPADEAPLGMYLGIGGSTRSLRSVPNGERRTLIVGGEGHKVGQGDGADAYQRLGEWMVSRFGAGELRWRWSAHDLMSPDGLPMIGQLAPFAPRILVATGFSKWGIAAGVAAAELLARRLTGEPEAHDPVFTPQRLNLRSSLIDVAKENADVALRFTADRLRRESGNGLEPGEGRVVGSGLRQIAESRDREGNLHRVSARCTHLGCIVRWNEGDATWDCPCHGSRFEPDGSVRNGPAAAPLRPVDPSG